MDNSRTQAGFTIVELIIASTLGAMLAVTLFTLTIYFYGGVLRNDAQAKLIVESQNVLRLVVEDLRLGSGVRVNNTILDANEPLGGWTTSNDDLILIVATPSLDSNGEFIIDTLNGGPFLDEIIYFSDQNRLFKRILANPNATGNTASTTCPEAVATASCPPDRLLSDNFDDMFFVFYDQDDAVTLDPTLARSIGITIQMFKNALGQDVAIDNNIRATLRNTL